MQRRQITPEIAIADQPTAADLETLKQEGYLGVVNLRHPGEPDQPLEPAAEGQKVRELGMNYLHQGVGGQPLSEEAVAAVGTFLDEHAGSKVLVHCRKGGRAAALVLLHLARSEGWSAAEAVTRGRQLGLEVEGGLRAVVEQYLNEHPPAAS
jgi:uncharacterized protein (TIGR01244 family)